MLKRNLNIAHFFSLPYLYTYTWCIYNLQGFILGTMGGGISYFLLGVMSIISGYCLIYSISHYKLNLYMKGLSVLALYFICAGIIRMITNERLVLTFEQGTAISSMSFLRTCIVSILPIYVFYFSSKKKLYTIKDVRITIIPFTIVCVFQFIQYVDIANNIFGFGERQNNTGYLFASIIPSLVFLKSKPKEQMLILMILLSFIFICVKRGAILVGTLAILFILYDRMKQSKSFAIIVSLLFVIIIVVLYSKIDLILRSDSLLVRRLQSTLEGDSANRDTLYSYFVDRIINETSFFRIIFGYGADGTVLLFGQYAHNDWLEIFIDFGFIGFCVYLIYWMSYLKTMVKFKKTNPLFYKFMYATAIILLPKTLMSMSINDMSLYITSVIGFVMGSTDIGSRNTNRNLYINTNRK